MRLSGMQKKLYRLTYDKPALNKKVLQLRKSLDEVKRVLGGAKKDGK